MLLGLLHGRHVCTAYVRRTYLRTATRGLRDTATRIASLSQASRHDTQSVTPEVSIITALLHVSIALNSHALAFHSSSSNSQPLLRHASIASRVFGSRLSSNSWGDTLPSPFCESTGGRWEVGVSRDMV